MQVLDDSIFRVIYASATGASEPKNMAYMVRLGIWGEGSPFREFNDFIQAVEKRGVGAMEIVAMDMKLRGEFRSILHTRLGDLTIICIFSRNVHSSSALIPWS